MERAAMERLRRWKKNGTRKPLIVRGARQTGKTWLMEEFGKSYADAVYLNFDDDPQLCRLFEADSDVSRIVAGLEVYAGHRFNPANTLLIFDEVQESPKALASLKYFNEDAPQYSIVCAVSFWDGALPKGASYPTGKVEFLDLSPLSFTEYMTALGWEELVQSMISGEWEKMSTFAPTLVKLLTQYCYVGGMPEAVARFAEGRNFGEVRGIQRRILEVYERDFSKRAPRGAVPKIRSLWNSIPAQLAMENRKFVHGLVRDETRANDYELAVLWLSGCGLIHKLHRVSVPRSPLAAYEDPKAFKLFFLDVGLLSSLARLRPEAFLDGGILRELKGALAEQYVLQQFKTFPDVDVRYWADDSGAAEVDFVADVFGKVVPIEVKAAASLQAKSLRAYHEKFQPSLSIRSSLTGYKREDWFLRLPLYAIEALPHVFSRRDTSFTASTASEE